MDVYSTEDEQVEALKKWWSENGKSVIGGVIIGIAILFGGRTWIQQQHSYVENASSIFEGMMQDVAQDKKEHAAELGSQLLGQYADTPYAVLAALALARIKVDEGDITTAKTHLRYAFDKAQDEEIKHIVRLRLARVLKAESSYDEALQLLNAVQPGTFKATYEELKGDIYVAKGDIDLARNAYIIALAMMEAGSRNRNFLQMKLDDLGETEQPSKVS